MAPLGQSEASFEAGLYVVVAVVVILLVLILCFACCIAREPKTYSTDDLELQQNHSENERLVKESSKRKKETLRRDDLELQQDQNRLKGEKETLGKDNLKREKKRLGQDCEELQQDRNSENERLVKASSKRKKETLRRDCEELQQDRNSENERLVKESSKRKKETLRRDSENERLVKDNLKIENERLRREKEDLQMQNETLKREKEKVEAEKEDLQKDYETLKREKENIEDENKGLQKNYDDLQGENERLGKDFKELQRNTNTCGYALGRAWEKMTEDRVNMTLDPDTASPSLTVSEDGSQVRFTGERSAEWPSVLGREGFTSGRHYWEVEVGEKGYWVLGVSTHPHEKSIPEKPGEGYWLVRLVRGKTCTAVSQSGDQILKLEKICKVWGVYLDHEGGRLSFCNAWTRFHIYTLEGPFPGQVYPIFSPGSHDKGPLIIQ